MSNLICCCNTPSLAVVTRCLLLGSALSVVTCTFISQKFFILTLWTICPIATLLSCVHVLQSRFVDTTAVTSSCSWVCGFSSVVLRHLMVLLHVHFVFGSIMIDVADLMSYCNVTELYACWSSCFCLLGTILVRFADLQRCSALLVITLHVFCLFSCIWAHCASVFYNPPILWHQFLWLFFGIMLCCR